MRSWRLALQQVRWHNKAFWRNPTAAFFVFAFPLMFLVILTALLGPVFDTVNLRVGQNVTPEAFYTGSILAFSILTASYSNVAISVTALREDGILKRVRSTPLPGWSYLLGKVLQSWTVMALLVAIVVGFGVTFYDIHLFARSIPALVVTVTVGAVAFCLLGLATSTIIPNVDAALPLTNAFVLPLVFMSGMFLPNDLTPRWMRIASAAFPVRHFNEALIDAFLPTARNPDGWALGHLAFVMAWGLGAAILVFRRFRWEPRR